MKADITEKYDLRVPRYTSYPTAPHFNDKVNGAMYREWLGALDFAVPLSLYFHIPFCDSMCWFCGCYTKIVKRYEPVKEYLDTMLREIDLVADALPGRFQAKHIHWGGGSPTMLKGEDWRLAIDKLRSRFDIGETAEIAVELDPRTATEDYVKALAAAGVNRTSIGVQGFHQDVQEAINRVQPFEITERVVGWLRKHGINNVNLDLMYGLPYQTPERAREQAAMAAALKPVRVALFGYAHVPWIRSHQKMIDESLLPDTTERWKQFVASSEKLLEEGYVAVGLDHFALPADELATALKEGRLHRNFQGYTTDEAAVMLGFGASSIGFLPQGYVQNAPPLKAYKSAIDAGEFPIFKGLQLSSEDRLRGDIIERLMCDFAIDLDAVSSRHQDAPTRDFRKELAALAPLVEDGIINIKGAEISITEYGRPFSRLVAAAFDSYLNIGEKRHSKAV
ncbi:MAG: oxygen-independent coproporphyrinogen III oxidase [Rhodospirillales bacterium RIFCSPLOWO2_12_FULL_58_28]|nr:MAG: oxygen-independent coproporphyrinogen III oxidase [Rhodospirillales bacterium RIFCSPLOWO2_12_FULL_58_28]